MTNPKPAPAREGAIATCPPWCTADHDDTGNYDMHTTDIVQVPAYSSDLWSHAGEPNAHVGIYAKTFGAGRGVTVEIGTMKTGGEWAQEGSVTAEGAGVLALSLALFSTYTDEPAKV